VSYHGIANLIDSLNAIKKFVYHENLIGKQELMEALKADFKGYEKVRSMLQSAPKYGNDDPEADGMAREVIEYTWQELYQHETPRGGRYLASVILFTTYYGAGLQVAATPDGRKAFDVLTDSVGAAQGRDLNGPTSLLKSVASLPLYLAVGSPVLNLRFQKKMLKTDDELRKLAALIRSFFKQGGLQVQIAVISTEDMKAAQAEPEKYKNLIVRIGGYSEYFNRLDKELQDSVIARTEHGL
jgi:formate C-acetyltransferase